MPSRLSTRSNSPSVSGSGVVGSVPWATSFTVEQAIAVSVVAQWVSAVLPDLLSVGQPVVVGVAIERIGAVDEDLLTIGEPIAIGVGGIGPIDQFLSIWQAVAVTVTVEGIGAETPRLRHVRQTDIRLARGQRDRSDLDQPLRSGEPKCCTHAARRSIAHDNGQGAVPHGRGVDPAPDRDGASGLLRRDGAHEHVALEALSVRVAGRPQQGVPRG